MGKESLKSARSMTRKGVRANFSWGRRQGHGGEVIAGAERDGQSSGSLELFWSRGGETAIDRPRVREGRLRGPRLVRETDGVEGLRSTVPPGEESRRANRRARAVSRERTSLHPRRPLPPTLSSARPSRVDGAPPSPLSASHPSWPPVPDPTFTAHALWPTRLPALGFPRQEL